MCLRPSHAHIIFLTVNPPISGLSPIVHPPTTPSQPDDLIPCTAEETTPIDEPTSSPDSLTAKTEDVDLASAESVEQEQVTNQVDEEELKTDAGDSEDLGTIEDTALSVEASAAAVEDDGDLVDPLKSIDVESNIKESDIPEDLKLDDELQENSGEHGDILSAEVTQEGQEEGELLQPGDVDAKKLNISGRAEEGELDDDSKVEDQTSDILSPAQDKAAQGDYEEDEAKTQPTEVDENTPQALALASEPRTATDNEESHPDDIPEIDARKADPQVVEPDELSIGESESKPSVLAVAEGPADAVDAVDGHQAEPLEGDDVHEPLKTGDVPTSSLSQDEQIKEEAAPEILNDDDNDKAKKKKKKLTKTTTVEEETDENKKEKAAIETEDETVKPEDGDNPEKDSDDSEKKKKKKKRTKTSDAEEIEKDESETKLEKDEGSQVKDTPASEEDKGLFSS